MKTILLRPGDPQHDFAQLAAWFSLLEDEPSTEKSLQEYYASKRERTLQQVALDEHNKLAGFSWLVRRHAESEQADFTLYVRPVQRSQGIGSRLYASLEKAARSIGVSRLRVNVRDTSPESRLFAHRRGFHERMHQFGMQLDLDAFDDRPYDALLARLEGEGFRFTSLEALGNTAEAQHKLYTLNDSVVMTIPGQGGEHAWDSFEHFQEAVCSSTWYKPGGQIIAIDTTNGAWAAMSAITRKEGQDHAYNLFTGVDLAYRGRKLGRAVKVLALRYARQELGAHAVHTHHNTQNLPMIAIDEKFGYRRMAGDYVMEKVLE